MNYIFFDKELKYPNNSFGYSPSELYPEYQYKAVAQLQNKVYESIRKIFYDCGLDRNNYNTKHWNPLGEYIKPGDTVLIKPNLVLHKNNRLNHEKDMEPMVTHPSIIRCVLDYVLISLKDTGTVYIGDAPVKDCDLNLLKTNYGYDEIIDFYSNIKTNVKIEWVDLRGPEEEREAPCLYKGILVDLNNQSFFYNHKKQSNLRIPNYDFRKVVQHHMGNKQEYLVNELALKSNVIINLPKPKTHRKNGYTGALKNFVGIVYSKEYLPHHTVGDAKVGGDEYSKNTLLRQMASYMRNHRDICRINYNNSNETHEIYKSICKFNYINWIRLEKIVRKIDKIFNSEGELDKVTEGTWYRNDTLWRTVLDLNNIIHYADSQGNMQSTMQRKILNLCDMVVSGEGEGPLAPMPKQLNTLLFTTNVVENDAILVKMMHFNKEKIAIIKNALHYKLFNNNSYENITVFSNLEEYNNKNVDEIIFSNYTPFIAAYGWKGYIEE